MFGRVIASALGRGTVMQGGQWGLGVYFCVRGGARTMSGIEPGATRTKPKVSERRAVGRFRLKV